MTYSVKEIFYTLQGEGHHAGRPAVFCRCAGCNLWWPVYAALPFEHHCVQAMDYCKAHPQWKLSL